jgi:hypothetical protein
MQFVAPIVEGHGEVEAVPALLHRIAASAGVAGDLRVNPPIRVKSRSFLQDDGYFRKQVALAAAKAAQSGGAVLILLDCEDECPAALGPDLLRRARAVRDDVAIIVALAYREYETWFVTAASSLRGLHGLPRDLVSPELPENIRDAKGWLGARMTFGYDPVIHQLEFTRRFNLDQAMRNPSFHRFYRRIRELLDLGHNQAPQAV